MGLKSLEGGKEEHRMRRLGVVTAALLGAGFTALALGGVAAAQAVVELPEQMQSSSTVTMAFAQDGDVNSESEDSGGENSGEDADKDSHDFSAEDEAVFAQFEECLRDAGVDLDFDGEVELDDSVIGAVVEQCDPILEELGDFEIMFEGDFSPEDDAVFELFDQCLDDAETDLDESAEADEDDAVLDAAFDAAFEQCEILLDDLTGDFDFDVDFDFNISPEDEAVFEHYDQCLGDAGLLEDVFGDSDFDEDGLAENDLEHEAIDAIFEQCDPILNELSDDVQVLFADCPEDED